MILLHRIGWMRSVDWLRSTILTSSITLSLALAPATPGNAQEAAAAVKEPRSIAELTPEPIPDAENAAAKLEALGPSLDVWSQQYGQFSQTPLGMAYDERQDRGEPPTAEQVAAIQEIMGRYAELDAELQRAAAYEKYASRADFTKNSTQFIEELLPRIQKFRAVGRFYAWRMQLLTSAGEHDEAVRRGVELLKLSRLHSAEPTLVNALVTIAVRHAAAQELYDALAAGPVSFKMHATLDAELALLDDPGYFARVLRTERAYAASAEQEAWPNRIERFFAGGRGASDYVDAVMTAAVAGPWETLAKEARDGGKWAAPTGFGVMADQLAPAVVASIQACGRDLAVVRSLRAYNALRLFAKTEKREATGLAELDLPEAAIVDPFSGKPLQAERTDAGWVVYSVMANGADDGGDFRDQLDYGVAPAAVRLRR